MNPELPIDGELVVGDRWSSRIKREEQEKSRSGTQGSLRVGFEVTQVIRVDLGPEGQLLNGQIKLNPALGDSASEFAGLKVPSVPWRATRGWFETVQTPGLLALHY